MNNPLQQPPGNYLRSPGGPPISKKQRGGSTPGSIRARSRSRGKGGPPPPGPPPGASSGQHHHHQQQHQHQQQPSPAARDVDDAIARRRAELRRLQKKAQGTRSAATAVSTGTPPEPKTLAGDPAAATAAATSNSNSSGGPPPKPAVSVSVSGPPPTKTGGAKLPPVVSSEEAVTAAIATASVASISVSTVAAEERKPSLAAVQAKRAPPPAIATNPSNESSDANENENATLNGTVASNAASNPNLPPQTPLVGAIPPTPAVGRRLEFPSGKKTAAAAAAGSPSLAAVGSNSSAFASGSNGAKMGPPRAGPPSRRARSKSPAVRKGHSVVALSSADGTANPKAVATKRNRAKSAPPRRPPGPPPGGRPKPPPAAAASGPSSKPIPSRRPAPMTASSLLHSKVKAKASKEKRKATTKVKTQDEGTKTRVGGGGDGDVTAAAAAAAAAAVEPPTLDPNSSKSLSKSLDDTKSDPSTAPAHSKTTPPPTDAVVAIGTGSLDTTDLTPPPLVAETPLQSKTNTKTSSSAIDGSGTKTPPSSGSSARRQKLQLMREQAAAASELKPNASHTKPSFSVAIGSGTDKDSAMAMGMGLSSGAPATEAFAKAIGAGTVVPPSTTDTKADPTKTDGASSEGPPTTASMAPPMRSAAQSRLEDAYQKSERDKTAALLKIKQLEDELSQKTKEDIQRAKVESTKSNTHHLQQLLSIAESQGPQAALQWAKTSLHDGPLSPSRLAAQRGFHTGMGVNHPATPRRKGSISDASPMRRTRIAGRHLTPHPTDNADDPHANETPEQTERRLLRSFREAAKYVPFEFSSDLATYTVRRPYGIPNNAQLFDLCQPPPSQQQQQAMDPRTLYAKRAHVSDQTTLEVAAVVKADNTPVLIFGGAGIRYRTNPNGDWIHHDNVDALDRPLGHVTYIDSAANEKEYSLDELLEEAFLVREQYCGTVTSTALGLEGRPPIPEARTTTPAQQPPELRKAPSKDVGVGTDAAKTNRGASPSQQQKQQQTQQQPEKDASSSSSDVLVVFLGMLVSFVFRLVWGVVVGTPLRILRTAVVLTAACFLLQAFHFYLADDYNTWALREMTHSSSSLTAGDLVFHSNRQPGIM